MLNDVRESGIGESSRPKPDGDFDGVTRASAMQLLMEEYNAEYYRGLGQTLPRRQLHQGVKMLAALVGIAVQVIVWSGPRLAPGEAAAILASPGHLANVTPVDFPPIEGTVGVPLKGSPYLFWYQNARYAHWMGNAQRRRR